MRLRFFQYFLIWLTTISFVGAFEKNLVYDYIAKYANFSTDPCDDFFAHVCPTSQGHFRYMVDDEKTRILKKAAENGHRFSDFWMKDDVLFEYKLHNAINKGEAMNICNLEKIGNVVIYNLAKMFDSIVNSVINLETSCEHNAMFISANYNQARVHRFVNAIENGAKTVAVFETLVGIEKRIKQLFSDIKEILRAKITRTPWARNKNVTQIFLQKLDNMTLNDFGTFSKYIDDGISAYMKAYNDCVQWNAPVLFCKASAVQIGGQTIVGNPIASGRMIISSANDCMGKLFNMDDNNVYIPTFMQMVAHEDNIATFYGLIGFLTSHEVMHSFVYEQADKSPLKYLWTIETGCIADQTRSTCKTFGIPCPNDLSSVFEEDAADLNGIRIAFDLYKQQKALIIDKKGRFGIERKASLTRDSRHITDDQLFFYASAAHYCEGLPTDYSAAFYRPKKLEQHSKDPIRVNNARAEDCQEQGELLLLPLQLFNDGFQVKDCVHYGTNAPERKAAGAEPTIGLEKKLKPDAGLRALNNTNVANSSKTKKKKKLEHKAAAPKASEPKKQTLEVVGTPRNSSTVISGAKKLEHKAAAPKASEPKKQTLEVVGTPRNSSTVISGAKKLELKASTGEKLATTTTTTPNPTTLAEPAKQ
ncbi:unnamed protein product [Caenorhabditis bovis]|uniref:Peptidase M13 C-terminal domain-containing protein n=1 Tax=Caenorhabditis bovis TaxID=2654633 RepID=A0A8S1EZY5_9PELO|nr:unnamed protein product [Caenorhabditis bovis]